ncbi:Transposase [Actinacidiphila yanglinensis]|uniref:Transposase n=1 Tax=Actinacidiphila yanglinensis TaxID=310779 RepID=A0A1H6ECA5_9ACTN|nr:Transposase [Actinacidiphila yanglinensis]
MTEGLLALRAWLVSEGITLVGMEATGSYWKPVYYILEEHIETWLLNAQHMRNVPGRKTDVRDCQWICQLIEHGLVRPSFVPPKPIRQLRDLTRYRTEVTRERTREIQRLEKLLEDPGIKLSSVVSDLGGKSARTVVEALIAGERGPHTLAQLGVGALKDKESQLAQALTGLRSAKDLNCVERADSGGEGAEQEPEGCLGQMRLEACAEVSAQEATGPAGHAQQPVRGDVAGGREGEQRVGGRADARGHEGGGEGRGCDGADRYAAADEDRAEQGAAADSRERRPRPDPTASRNGEQLPSKIANKARVG